jgi:hypothetical protein
VVAGVCDGILVSWINNFLPHSGAKRLTLINAPRLRRHSVGHVTCFKTKGISSLTMSVVGHQRCSVGFFVTPADRTLQNEP